MPAWLALAAKSAVWTIAVVREATSTHGPMGHLEGVTGIQFSIRIGEYTDSAPAAVCTNLCR
jgi:hypothetical protein